MSNANRNSKGSGQLPIIGVAPVVKQTTPVELSPELAAQIERHRAVVAAREAFWKRWNEGKGVRGDASQGESQAATQAAAQTHGRPDDKTRQTEK